jgi:peptidoglycan/LPS O-acetylase OafA/YrhL
MIGDIKNRNYTLDALRGFSAVLVVLYHIVNNGKYLDPNYLPKCFDYFYEEGHFRVLIFFIISGSVISLSNKKPLELNSIYPYLKKRIKRIYPIYFVSLLITLLVSTTIYSLWTIIGNFVFMQVLVADVLLENGPIWTLHYEIIFYLLFIPISLFEVNPVKLLIITISIGLLNYFFIYPILAVPILTTYCFGFIFWVCGLIIVKYFTTKNSSPLVYSTLFSFLLFLIAVPRLNLFDQIIHKSCIYFLGKPIEFSYDGNVNNWFKIAFTFSDFAYLPYGFLAVILFLERKFKFLNITLWFIQILPAIYLLMNYKYLGNRDKLLFPVICYILSCYLLVAKSSVIETVSKKIISGLIWLGGISYGIYIIHGPLIVLFSRITFFSGSSLSFIVRFFLYISLTFLTGYFLEKIAHVWIISALASDKIILYKKYIKSNLPSFYK